MLTLLISIMITYAVFALGFALVEYLLYGFGLSSMLKTCGYKKPWHAFVPFCRDFALGTLSEVYNDGNPPKKRGKTLLTFSILRPALSVVYEAIYLALIIPAIKWLYAQLAALSVPTTETDFTALVELFNEFTVATAVVPPLLSLLSLAVSVVSICYAVYHFIALYRVYKIFAPSSAVVLIVVSIFVSPASAVILFVLRKKAAQNLRWQAQSDDYTESSV